jgi:hypothetical protein
MQSLFLGAALAVLTRTTDRLMRAQDRPAGCPCWLHRHHSVMWTFPESSDRLHRERGVRALK